MLLISSHSSGLYDTLQTELPWLPNLQYHIHKYSQRLNNIGLNFTSPLTQKNFFNKSTGKIIGDLWQCEKPHRPTIQPRNIKKFFLKRHECIKYVDRYESTLSFSTIKHIQNSCKKVKIYQTYAHRDYKWHLCNWEKYKQK